MVKTRKEIKEEFLARALLRRKNTQELRDQEMKRHEAHLARIDDELEVINLQEEAYLNLKDEK